MKNIIYIFLSFLMIFTGFHRLHLKDEMIDEHDRIFPELPSETMYLIPVFEIISSFLIWTEYRNIVLSTYALGVIGFIISILCRRQQRQQVLDTYKDVFTFKSTTTCIVLHLAWVFIILIALR